MAGSAVPPLHENWIWYADDAAEPTVSLAAENVAFELIDPTIILRLRVSLKDPDGQGTTTWTMYYSRDDVNYTVCGPTGDFDFANGLATAGGTVTTFKTSDGTAKGTYHENATGSDAIAAGAYKETDWALKATSKFQFGVRYYFRIRVGALDIDPDTGKTHPQIFTWVPRPRTLYSPAPPLEPDRKQVLPSAAALFAVLDVWRPWVKRIEPPPAEPPPPFVPNAFAWFFPEKPLQTNWIWYADDAAEPVASLAAENVAPQMVENTINKRLRVSVYSSPGQGNTTWFLSWSTDDLNFTAVGPTGDWDYANGQAVSGAATTTFKTSDGTAHGNYHESGAGAESILLRTFKETDWALVPTGKCQPATRYYFRVSVGTAVLVQTGKTHPQIVTAWIPLGHIRPAPEAPPADFAVQAPFPFAALIQAWVPWRIRRELVPEVPPPSPAIQAFFPFSSVVAVEAWRPWRLAVELPIRPATPEEPRASFIHVMVAVVETPWFPFTPAWRLEPPPDRFDKPPLWSPDRFPIVTVIPVVRGLPGIIPWDEQAQNIRYRRHERAVSEMLNSLLFQAQLLTDAPGEWQSGYDAANPVHWRNDPPETVTEALDRIATLLLALTGQGA